MTHNYRILLHYYYFLHTDMPLLFCIPAGTPCRGCRRPFFKKVFAGGL